MLVSQAAAEPYLGQDGAESHGPDSLGLHLDPKDLKIDKLATSG